VIFLFYLFGVCFLLVFVGVAEVAGCESLKCAVFCVWDASSSFDGMKVVWLVCCGFWNCALERRQWRAVSFMYLISKRLADLKHNGK
jgi:hypothetical protein